MATLSSLARARRVFGFLLGLRDDRVLSLLATRGFTLAEHEHGWDLMRRFGMTHSVPRAEATATAWMSALEQWRMEWMRIVRVSLVHSFPEIHDELFRGAEKPGASPLQSVVGFLDGLTKLQAARDATHRAAMDKLRQRGLTPERIEEGRAKLEELKRPAHAPGASSPQRRAELAKAEQELWHYYIEWSEIARSVIKDKRLLAQLGYAGGNAPDDEETPLDPVAIAAPATASRSEPNKKAGRRGARTTGKKAKRKR